MLCLLNLFLAIRFAARNGHWQVIAELLKDQRVDPRAENNYCMRYACENGHLEVLKVWNS